MMRVLRTSDSLLQTSQRSTAPSYHRMPCTMYHSSILPFRASGQHSALYSIATPERCSTSFSNSILHPNILSGTSEFNDCLFFLFFSSSKRDTLDTPLQLLLDDFGSCTSESGGLFIPAQGSHGMGKVPLASPQSVGIGPEQAHCNRDLLRSGREKRIGQ